MTIATATQGGTLPKITCPKCKTAFLLTDALRLEIEESVLDNERAHHKRELERQRLATEEHTRELLVEQFTVDLQAARDDAKEQRAQNKQLTEQLVELNKQMRRLNTERDTESLRNETKLRELTEAIRAQERERSDEANRLRQMETEKKLSDAVADADRLRARLEQGSQQLQGEVLELDLEAQLRSLFPGDEIAEIKKGQRGADVRHLVKTPLGAVCGSILWETKNAQWQQSWLTKLRSDMRESQADQAVLISAHTPESIGVMAHVEGTLWVARPKVVAALGTVLRQALLRMHAVMALSVNKDERIEALYRYVTGPEFRHRMEAMGEAFQAMQHELDQERTWFARKWARQEKALRSMVDNVSGLHGDFEGLNGASLSALESADADDAPQELAS